MAKRLLLNVLVDVLGNYVEGLTVENLKLGVWSGKIELNNMKLKENALEALNLPIEITHGSLSYVRVKIPWTALESKPVKIEISGVYLQAGPLDLSKLSPDQIRKSMFLAKRAKLQEAEDFILINGDITSKDAKEAGQSSSYFRNLALKIIDNLEITLTNVHIRYEDNGISIPNQCLSAGLTIASLRLSTTDENWRDAFVNRGKDAAAAIIRKLGVLENLGAYWNTNDQHPLNDLGSDKWFEAMHNLIYGQISSETTPKISEEVSVLSLNYLLAPPNSLTLKVVHRPHGTTEQPKVDMSIISSQIVVNFDKVQYQQLLSVAATFSQLERYKQMSVYRPQVRPTNKVNATLWWKYALKLVLGKDLSVSNRIETMIKSKKIRNHYIDLLKQARKARLKNPGIIPAEDKEIGMIEEDLPYPTLVIFRKMAAIDMLKEPKAKKSMFSLSSSKPSDARSTASSASATSLAPPKSSSMFSGWFKKKDTDSSVASLSAHSSTSPLVTSSDFGADDELEDDMLIENIQSQFHIEDDTKDEFPIRVKLETSAQLHLLSSGQSIVDVTVAMRADVDVKAHRVAMIFSLGNMIVEDVYTKNPNEKYLFRPRCFSGDHHDINSGDQLKIVLDSWTVNKKSSLSLGIIPLDITFNAECFQKILEIFLYRPPVIKSMKAGPTKSQILSSMSHYAREMTSGPSGNGAGTFSLSIDINSPNIILPRNTTDDSAGYLVLDCGHFNMIGLISSTGIQLDAKIKGINIGMPDSNSVRNELQRLGLYLVKPFDVELSIQDLDKSVAELNLTFRISPYIEADIDVVKLRRMIAIILKVAKTITEALSISKEEAFIQSKDQIGFILRAENENNDVGWLVDADHSSISTSDEPSSPPPIIHKISAPIEQRKDVFISISIESVVINLTLSPSHRIDCIVESLILGVLVSSFETTVTVDLKNLIMNDSMRPEKFQRLVWTPPPSSSDTILLSSTSSSSSNFFHMGMVFFSGKGSTLYRGYGSEISLEFLCLGLDLDDKAILRLCPFFRELTKSYDDLPQQMRRPTIADIKSSSSLVDRSSPSSDTSMRLDITIATVTLNMVQPRKSVGFERLFALNIVSFAMQYESLDKSSMTMSIQNIDAYDTRHESENYYYKSLFSRSTLASEYGSASKSTSSISKSDSDDLSNLMKSSSNLSTEKDDKIFHMTFYQESPSVSRIEIDAQDITTFISPDSLLTFVNVLMVDINALIAMIGAITSKSTDSSEIKPESTLKLTVSVSNPRLLVLEDPSDKNTQAIVSKCRVVLNYTSDTSDFVTHESLHVSLQDAEIFILQGLSIGLPQQIVDPTNIEFNMKKTTAKSKILSARFSVNIDVVNIFVSFHDILLSHSIINRAIQIASVMDISTGDDGTMDMTSSSASSSSIERSVTMYEVVFQSRSVTLVVMNDYGSQNLPILRCQLKKTEMQASGPIIQMHGEGSFIISVDYYNAKVTTYEPIIEPWCPIVMLSTDTNSISMEILNENTLQLNISGSLTRTLIDCSQLLSSAVEDYRKSHMKHDVLRAIKTSINIQSRRISPTPPHEISSRYQLSQSKRGRPEDIPITFINTLGVPIDIVEHRTKAIITSIDGVGRVPIHRSTLRNVYFAQNSSSGSRLHNRDIYSTIPYYYDIHLLGDLQNTYQPLFQLPLNINVARHYYLQYKSTNPQSTSSSTKITSPQVRQISPKPKGPKTPSLFHGEEEVEEIYENSRYDVMTRKWGKPWNKFGDPDEYTDSKARPSLSPTEKQLPSDKWEWVEPAWRVDMVGVVGRDIDEQGYEYNINFVNFSVKKKRSYQPLDSVRRRKWIRTRRMIPNLPQIADINNPRNPIHTPSNLWMNTSSTPSSSTPVAVFWDVRLQPDGSRNIMIRSGFSVKNAMRFPLDIRLGGYADPSDKGSVTYGPIAPGDVFYFPINNIHANTIEVRPSTINEVEFAWSIGLDCRLRDSHQQAKKASSSTKEDDNNSIKLFFIDCNILRGAAETSMSDMSKNVKKRVFMRTIFDFSSDKGVSIECAPFAILYNRLPSSFAFKCLSGDVKEHGIVTPATHYEFVYTNPTLKPTFSIQLGSYIWSNPRPFDQGQYLLDLVSPFKSSEGINLTMNVTTNRVSGLVEIYIYSKFALIDRTGLNMSIRTRRFSEKQISYDLSANNSVTYVPNPNSQSNDTPSNFMEVNNTIERRTYDDNVEHGHMDAMNSWTTGGNGVVLFQSANDNAILGFKSGKIWSFTISLVSLGTTMNALEVLDKETKRVYQLAYQIVPLPYIYQETQGLIVMPWFRIVNCMDEYVEVRQVGEKSSSTINAQMSEGWHRVDSNKETKLHFKTPTSLWSLGTVDINEIGSSVLLIPGGIGHPTTNTGADAILLHIEVKLADSGDLSYMTILIWKETTESRGQWTISVRNDTVLPITIRQDMKDTVKDIETLSKYEMCYEPHTWLPFGWADQSISSSIVACIGTTLVSADANLCCTLNMLKLGESALLSLDRVSSEYSGEHIKFTLQAVGSGKVLHITRVEKLIFSSFLTEASPLIEIAYQKDLKIYFRSVGISLIAERPTRHEFLSCYVEDVEAMIIIKDETHTESASNSFEFKIHDIQVDNYSESAVYPVLLHSFDSATRKKATRVAKYKKSSSSSSSTSSGSNSPMRKGSDDEVLESLHFFQFTAIQERPLGLDTMIFKYIALRVLEIRAAIDSSTIQLYLLDVHNDLIGDTNTHDQIENLSEVAVNQWVDSYNEYMTIQVANPVDPVEAKKLGQAYKVYVETLVIHPFKITASFMTTPFPRDQKYDIFSSKKYSWLHFIRGIAGVEDLVLKINSFIVNNVMESQPALLSRISYKITKELQSQILAIAGNVIGSLNVIGRPAGLYKNIGAGVEDFFYEPYQGAMHSPQDFFVGLKRGAGSLIQGVGRGVITSAAAVVGSASSTVAKGATYLTMDDKFTKDREARRREQNAQGGGMLAGFRAGGENVVTGFRSGLTGLITKPIEEGRKSGATGFLKGVGLGMVGAAVKPIMGISDGIASVSQGLTNAVSENTLITPTRPPRAFDRSPSDERDLILVNLNVAAAVAQQSVHQWSRKDQYQDAFLAYIDLGYPDTVAKNQNNQDIAAVILSEKYVFLIRHDVTQMWKYPFGNISHIEYLGDYNTIRLVLYQDASSSRGVTDKHMDIHCNSNQHAITAYKIFAIYAYRMGNPSQVVPVELLFKSHSSDTDQSTSSSDKISSSSSSSSSPAKVKKFTYRFGSINHIQYPSKRMATNAVIQEASTSFAQQIGNADFRNMMNISSSTTSNDNKDNDDNMTSLEGYMKSIDERCMQLICNWQANHTGIKASRCLATIIINLSSYPIQLTTIEIKEGRHYEIFSIKHMDGSLGYDATSHTIAPMGGSAVIFAYGKLPSVVDLAHVKLRIQGTAFNIQVSSRPIGTTCQAVGASSVGFLEKTLTDWWGKYVVLIM